MDFVAWLKANPEARDYIDELDRMGILMARDGFFARQFGPIDLVKVAAANGYKTTYS